MKSTMMNDFVRVIAMLVPLLLVVSCGGGGGAVGSVVANTAPVANAGPDQTMLAGDTVQLDGSGSGDADGDVLAYTWSFTAVPAGSAATLSDIHAVNPTFVADLPGHYTVELTVSDGHNNTGTAAVTATTLTLSSSNIQIAPAVITGGTTTTLTLTLPTLVSGTASTVMATITPTGGSSVAVTKSGGAAVTLSDLGSGISVDAPATLAADNKTFTYTLIVGSASGKQVSATGNLSVVPLTLLSSASIPVAPSVISGGTVTILSLPLPALTSGVASVSGIVLTETPAGGSPAAVTKSGGGAIALTDLGTSITIEAPVTVSTDNKLFTYTLTVSNAAGTEATATGTLNVVPVPVLASASFVVSPSVITGGTAPTLTLNLPSLTSSAVSAASVTFTVSPGGGSVTKSGGGAITAVDLGTGITIAAPGTVSTDNKSFTYTLTIANAAGTSVSATGTLSVVPLPVFSSPLLLVPSIITGGTSPTLTLSLPSLSIGSASSVALTVTPAAGLPSTVTKVGGSSVSASDLGSPISVNAPVTAAGANTTYTYALTATNAAGTSSAPVTAILTVTP